MPGALDTYRHWLFVIICVPSTVSMKTAGLIPLRAFSGPLKRVRFDENETMAMLILDLAFPHFRGLEPDNKQRLRIYEHFYGKGRPELLTTQHPRRRFSGGALSSEVLPRGRYYSLCNEKPSDAAGSSAVIYDHGVLQNELIAYTNYRAAGPVLVLDIQDAANRSILRSLGHPAGDDPKWDAFTVMFFRKPGARSIIDVIFNEMDHDPAFDNDQWGGGVTMLPLDDNPFSFLGEIDGDIEIVYCFNIHYRFDFVQLSHVVDLRYPDTQEAFVRTWDFKGWNLVDYRGAKNEKMPTLTDDLFTSPDTLIRVEVPPVSNEYSYGSWKIRGSMERSWQRFEDEVRAYFQDTKPSGSQ